MITADNYVRRRRQLAEAAEQPLIVLTGSDLVQKSSDETYEFEQDGYFYYLTGIEEPGWMLVMDVYRGDEFLISTAESRYHSEVWEDKASFDEVGRASGIGDIRNRRDGWHFLRTEAHNYQSIGTIVPRARFSHSFGMYINPAKTMLVERLRRAHKDANLIDISDNIRHLRTVKDDDEIAEIRQAIKTTDAGLQLVLNGLDDYANEADIFADLTQSFMHAGSNHGYRPIVASGGRAATIHYKTNNKPIERDAFLLIDTGALSGRYTADITRTYSIGNVSQRHTDVYQAVMAAKTEAFQLLKPGITMRSLEMHIEQFIGKQLQQLGVIDNLLRQDIRTYYPHAISHHLGIDVHDSCDYEQPLPVGAVITVEPGIYLREEGIGVRHEEDVLIAQNGIEVLSDGVGMQS